MHAPIIQGDGSLVVYMACGQNAGPVAEVNGMTQDVQLDDIMRYRRKKLSVNASIVGL